MIAGDPLSIPTSNKYLNEPGECCGSEHRKIGAKGNGTLLWIT